MPNTVKLEGIGTFATKAKVAEIKKAVQECIVELNIKVNPSQLAFYVFILTHIEPLLS